MNLDELLIRVRIPVGTLFYRFKQLRRSSFAYEPKEKPDLRALTIRIRDIASVRVRFGYRRITAMLRREGWQVGDRRVYNIYKAEGLEVRSKKRKKRAAVPRLPLPIAEAPSERWSMDFVCDKLTIGKRFRVLTVIYNFDRSCPVLYADRSIGGAQGHRSFRKHHLHRQVASQGNHHRQRTGVCGSCPRRLGLRPWHHARLYPSR